MVMEKKMLTNRHEFYPAMLDVKKKKEEKEKLLSPLSLNQMLYV